MFPENTRLTYQCFLRSIRTSWSINSRVRSRHVFLYVVGGSGTPSGRDRGGKSSDSLTFVLVFVVDLSDVDADATFELDGDAVDDDAEYCRSNRRLVDIA